MDGEWRKNQLYLAFTTGEEGEARTPGNEGTESSETRHDTESQAKKEKLMEEICRTENVNLALRRVRKNKGGAGVDGMTVKELPSYLREHWPRHRIELLEGAYKPQPVKRVEIPKPDGGKRKLGIPTCLDRMIQQMVLQVMQGEWDSTFSEHSYGFRPGRSALHAVTRAREYIRKGYEWVVDIDLEKFFDQVNHDKLMGKIAKRIGDKRVLKLIRAFLNAGVMNEGITSPTKQGTPQGGPLSPLLSNIVLDQLDRELENRGHRFCRYADDCNVYVKTERAGHRVMESITTFITRKLKLKVNEKKSKVTNANKSSFLGFGFYIQKKKPRIRISSKAIERFKERIRELTRRTRGRRVQQVVRELSIYMKGWMNYFGICETPSRLDQLESWIRRRLRSYIWKQWKTGPNRSRKLIALGIRRNLAKRHAWTRKGPWRSSRTEAITYALPRSYFTALGLPSFRYLLKLSSRTAVYGPVSTVVWEGGP